MHEASMMRDLMRKIEQVAQEQQATRVTALGIWLVLMSKVDQCGWNIT